MNEKRLQEDVVVVFHHLPAPILNTKLPRYQRSRIMLPFRLSLLLLSAGYQCGLLRTIAKKQLLKEKQNTIKRRTQSQKKRVQAVPSFAPIVAQIQKHHALERLQRSVC